MWGNMYIVQFQKISILHPQKELEFPGGWGFCKAYKFKEMYEDELEFPKGWVVLTKRPFLGGGMDIFWYTFLIL